MAIHPFKSIWRFVTGGNDGAGKTATPSPMTNKPKKKQVLQGKLTYLGILVSGLGALSNLFGVEVPTDEIKGMIGWVRTYWDALAQFAGIAMAAYGRLRLNWRDDK